MGNTPLFSNLREVTGRLGKNKWERAKQILQSYGLRGLAGRVWQKMHSGVNTEEELERSYILTNESCPPKREKPGLLSTKAMISFSAAPRADHAAKLDILTDCPEDESDTLRLEVFSGSERITDVSVPVKAGRSYTSVEFPPVRFNRSGLSPLTFVATCAGRAGIVHDGRKQHPDYKVTGGGRVFARLYASVDPVYRAWMHCNDPDEQELQRQRSDVFENPPRFSIVVPLYNTSEEYLLDMIESVRAQTYANWELCLADGSTDGRSRELLVRSFGDPRIKYMVLETNEGISGNTNRAIEMATGDFICLLDHDDTLAPQALYSNAVLLRDHPDCDFIYSDEDKLTAGGGRRCDPFFKPDYSPNMLDAFNYITHFAVIRRSLMDGQAWLQQRFDGAQDYDLIHRAAENARRVGHIPDILYHWRMAPTSTASSASAKDYTVAAGMRTLREALERRGDGEADVVSTALANLYTIRYPLPSPPPRVSVLIPSCGADAQQSINALASSSEYPDWEAVLVHDEVRTPQTPAGLQDRLTSVISPIDTSISAQLNAAASKATGDLLLFLDPHTDAFDAGWMEELARQAYRSCIGAAGGLILDTNGIVRNAGYSLYGGGIAGGVMAGLPQDSPGSFGRLLVARDVSAVSWSCMMMRRTVFENAGGLREEYRSALGDVDLCLRLREDGFQIIFVPTCRVFQNAPLPADDAASSRLRWLEDWLDTYPADPYGNPNLSCARADFDTWPGVRGESVANALAGYRKELAGEKHEATS